MGSADHENDAYETWERVFTTKPEQERSWSQEAPTPSLERIEALGNAPDDPIIDIGGGASRLVDHLVEAGHRDVTVLDISPSALCQARCRLGSRPEVHWVEADITTWEAPRRYRVWHDRAVCHFLVADEQVERYVRLVTDAVVPSGHAIIAAFAPGGPTVCSGLPVRQWAPDQMAAAFVDGFELVGQAHLVHITPWGGGQPFTWVVLRRR